LNPNATFISRQQFSHRFTQMETRIGLLRAPSVGICG
jgi:hypothetical protein